MDNHEGRSSAEMGLEVREGWPCELSCGLSMSRARKMGRLVGSAAHQVPRIWSACLVKGRCRGDTRLWPDVLRCVPPGPRPDLIYEVAYKADCLAEGWQHGCPPTDSSPPPPPYRRLPPRRLPRCPVRPAWADDLRFLDLGAAGPYSPGTADDL